MIHQHHGPDLSDIAFQDIPGDAVLNNGKLQAEQAVQELQVILYTMVQLVNEGFDLGISFGQLVFLFQEPRWVMETPWVIIL